MWIAAVTVEILVGGAVAGHRPLPQLSQVGIDITGGVARAAEAVGWRLIAAGLTAGVRRAGDVAGKDQPVLLVVTEVLRLAAARAALPRQGRLRGGETGDVAGRVIPAALAGNLPARAARAAPTGRIGLRAQIAVIAELLS